MSESNPFGSSRHPWPSERRQTGIRIRTRTQIPIHDFATRLLTSASSLIYTATHAYGALMLCARCLRLSRYIPLYIDRRRRTFRAPWRRRYRYCCCPFYFYLLLLLAFVFVWKKKFSVCTINKHTLPSRTDADPGLYITNDDIYL